MFRFGWLARWSLFIFLGCQENKSPAVLPYYNTPDFMPHFLTAQQAEKKITHKIDSFQVVDQMGKSITLQDLKGRIHIANFFFTRCGVVCPAMMQHLKKVVTAFQGDTSILFISYSVMPWVDSAQLLKEYALYNKYNSLQWHLCTGNTASIYRLARQSYFAEELLGYTKDSTDFLHTEHVLLVDPNLRLRGIYNASLILDMEQLQKDIALLRKELIE